MAWSAKMYLQQKRRDATEHLSEGSPHMPDLTRPCMSHLSIVHDSYFVLPTRSANARRFSDHQRINTRAAGTS